MILDRHYNRNLKTTSPVVVDYERNSTIVEGNEVVSFVEVDNRKRVIANGSEADWKLNNMLKAGINPATGIHTGNTTRLAGLNDLNTFKVATDKLLNQFRRLKNLLKNLLKNNL